MMDAARAARFWAKVNKTAGCWLWTASRNAKGYGYFGVGNRRVVIAHRLSWEMHNGPIPAGEGFHGTCVCHRCDTPSCVNPDHLFLGTMKENVIDAWAKGRGVNLPAAKRKQQTHCKYGHEYTPANTYNNRTGGRRCKRCMYLLNCRTRARLAAKH